MDSNNIIISFIYYLGIASCAAQGAEKGKKNHYLLLFHCIINAFGGGFMRDVVFLNVHPWLLTPSAFPDLMFVGLIGLFYIYCVLIHKTNNCQYHRIKGIVTITDIIGLGSFICIGIDKALTYSNNIFTIIACGYITAVGGGLLASLQPLTTIFKNKKIVYYHVVTVLGCFYYYYFRHSIYLILITTIGLFIVSADYKKMYTPFSFTILFTLVETRTTASVCFDRDSNNRRQKNNTYISSRNVYIKQSKIYLINKRIRQC